MELLVHNAFTWSLARSHSITLITLTWWKIIVEPFKLLYLWPRLKIIVSWNWSPPNVTNKITHENKNRSHWPLQCGQFLRTIHKAYVSSQNVIVNTQQNILIHNKHTNYSNKNKRNNRGKLRIEYLMMLMSTLEQAMAMALAAARVLYISLFEFEIWCDWAVYWVL